MAESNFRSNLAGCEPLTDVFSDEWGPQPPSLSGPADVPTLDRNLRSPMGTRND